jgi:hypothetical protein
MADVPLLLGFRTVPVPLLKAILSIHCLQLHSPEDLLQIESLYATEEGCLFTTFELHPINIPAYNLLARTARKHRSSVLIQLQAPSSFTELLPTEGW